MIHKKRKILFTIGGVFLLALVWMLWPQPFQGTWHESGGDAEFAWYRNTTLRWHHYEATGYPPLSESGWYWVTSREGEIYHLKVWVSATQDQKAHMQEMTIRVTGASTGVIDGESASR